MFGQIMPDDLQTVLNYHTATKHRSNAYSRAPSRLNWASQPVPFRRYVGSPLIHLQRSGLYGPEKSLPAPLNARSLSKLLFHSLAISAWKSFGGAKWSLRVNPSSGNLHPTEAYLILSALDGFIAKPSIFHYAPDEHGLEFLCDLDQNKWRDLDLPHGVLLIALSSIYWRESWKYGERAFRYCMLDSGHAIGTIRYASSCLGWKTALLDDLGTKDLDGLLNFPAGTEGELEKADCLLAIFPDSNIDGININEKSDPGLNKYSNINNILLNRDAFLGAREGFFQAKPNLLSRQHVSWPIIDEVVEATIKPFTDNIYTGFGGKAGPASSSDLCQALRQRRSAVALDGKTAIKDLMFYQILRRTIPGPLFDVLPWEAQVHMAIFIHMVDGLDRGIYMLIRDQEDENELIDSAASEFLWEKPKSCPSDLNFYLLMRGNAMPIAKQISCHQDIASNGCFCVAMLARFEEPLQKFGPWFYRRLYWECGMIGQALYLGAEESGLRGCGIGCFFDEAVHSILGLKGWKYQDLYHFTVGKPLEDPRIITHPAYPIDQ
jgi:SagB-type dehydrogenase family enzyme